METQKQKNIRPEDNLKYVRAFHSVGYNIGCARFDPDNEFNNDAVLSYCDLAL